MTNLEATTPGRELDALVAEKLGYQWVKRTGGLGHEVGRWVDPATGGDAYPGYSSFDEHEQSCYSTDIAAAWQLVELMVNKSHDYEVGNCFGEGHYAQFTPYKLKSRTAPHAICLAFLALPDEVVR